jgi:endonuclease/exonuclease/phosphatase family metal-dependent hydrolase
VRVITWNLFHGRSVPDTPRSLLEEFGSTLAAWEWDVALLQEVPPWWPGPLARACEADGRAVLTSRNFGAAARRWVAERRPDLIKSNGGGANAILVRPGGGAIGRHATALIRWWPERRYVHAVQLGESGLWVGNVHASTRARRAQSDMGRAGGALASWARGAPVLLGGDANVEAPRVEGFEDLGGGGIDRFLGRGVAVTGAAEVLDPGALSDHAPVRIAVS